MKGDITAAVKAMAGRTEGVGIHEVPGFTPRQVNMSALHGGMIVVGYRHYRRIFIHQCDADRYAGQLPELRAAGHRAKRQKQNERERAARAEKPKQAQPQPTVTIPRYTGQKWDKGQGATNPNGVKPQKLPGHPGYDMRYSLPPGAVVEGEFSRIPLGATLEAA